ncbi:MAG: TRAP transporter substrate-binding protein [Acidocella sp.]|jgi:tripartite ATP-independent transporter DctP family solute receptor|nr:TRAP transporter substrate-binding protein [Acidocella sp.]
MKNISRRGLLAGASALPLVAINATGARAASFHYKFATNLPPEHPLNTSNAAAIARIKAATDGALDIMLYPNSQLGTDPAMLNQVRSGAIQFFTLSPLILSTLVPTAAINGVGFAFANEAQAFKAMDGKLGALVRGEIEKAGLFAFDKIYDNGFRQITTSTHPIKTPDDLHNLRIRVPPAALWTSMFTDFGSAPTTVSFNEVYTGLQTHLVDAQENPLAIISTAKLYEVQKYCSMTNHMWDGFWLLANPAAFNALPADIQTIAKREFARAALEQRVAVAKLTSGLETSLKGNGLIFNNTTPAAFRAKLASSGFYTTWKAKFGDAAWSTLEGYTGTLA